MTFPLTESDHIPLNSLLKALHLVGTGGEAHVRIDNREVRVNGQIETQRRKKLRPGDTVEFQGKTIEIK